MAVNCRTSQLQTRKLSSSADEIELNNWKTLTNISHPDILYNCPENIGYRVINPMLEMNFNKITKEGDLNIIPSYDKKSGKDGEAYLNCKNKTYATKQTGKQNFVSIDSEHLLYVRVCKTD